MVAIGASLIAASISVEQIIGMSGPGYALGLAIASYGWLAALTLLIVGKFFLPVFLRNGICTMPQFLEERYGPRIHTNDVSYATSGTFNAGAVGAIAILLALYAAFW